jgi:hypothetical protein
MMDLVTVDGIVPTKSGDGQVSVKTDDLRQTTVSRIVGLNIPGTVFGPGGKKKEKNPWLLGKCFGEFFLSPVEGRRDRWTG